MMVEPGLQNLILQVFEEEEETFYFPLTSQKQARAFVRSLHRKGLQYQEICAEIGEIENNFVSWRKGLGRPGIGNRIINMINKPFEDVLRSDGEEEEEVDGRLRKKEEKIQKSNGGLVKMEDRVQNAWVKQLEKKIQDLEERTGGMERRQDSTEDESDNVTSSESQSSGSQSSESLKSSSETQSSESQKSSSESQRSSSSPVDLRESSVPSTEGEDKGNSEVMSKVDRIRSMFDAKETEVRSRERTPEDKNEIAKVTEEVRVESVPVSAEIHTNGMTEVQPVKSEIAKLTETKPENGTTEVEGLLIEIDQERRSSTDSVKSCTTEESDEGNSISSDSSSILENEITENYDSDLDMDSVDRDSDVAGLLRRLACFKAELSDGKGFVYVFTDCPSEKGQMRIKVGASRFPNRRLEQAMHYNVDIRMVLMIPVGERRAALREVLQRLHKSKVEGHEDWFRGDLETLLGEIKEASSKFTDGTSQC